jgi:anti-anti-sigma factor
MNDQRPFCIEMSGDRMVIRGEFDIGAIAAFAVAAGRLDGQAAVIDLSEMTFIDSCGLRALWEARNAHPGIRYQNPSGPVRRMLDLTGLGEILLDA